MGVDEENARRHRARELAALAAAAGDETGWFEALYGPVRARALAALHIPVARGGTLLVIARATDDESPERDLAMMPWALTRAELDQAGGPLRAVSVEQFTDDENPPKLRWRAEFRRD